MMNNDFQYRGLSMAELDEMIAASQEAGTEQLVKENARLRLLLRKIRGIAHEAQNMERMVKTGPRSYEATATIMGDLHAIVQLCKEIEQHTN